MKEKTWGFWRRGSLTVEAAALLPVLLLVIFGALSLGFFLYDRSCLISGACEAAVCGSMAGSIVEEAAEEAARLRAEERQRTTMLARREAVLVGTGQEVQVSITLRFSDQDFEFGWEAIAEGAYPLLQPSRTLREERRPWK